MSLDKSTEMQQHQQLTAPARAPSSAPSHDTSPNDYYSWFLLCCCPRDSRSSDSNTSITPVDKLRARGRKSSRRVAPLPSSGSDVHVQSDESRDSSDATDALHRHDSAATTVITHTHIHTQTLTHTPTHTASHPVVEQRIARGEDRDRARPRSSLPLPLPVNRFTASSSNSLFASRYSYSNHYQARLPSQHRYTEQGTVNGHQHQQQSTSPHAHLSLASPSSKQKTQRVPSPLLLPLSQHSHSLLTSLPSTSSPSATLAANTHLAHGDPVTSIHTFGSLNSPHRQLLPNLSSGHKSPPVSAVNTQRECSSTSMLDEEAEELMDNKHDHVDDQPVPHPLFSPHLLLHTSRDTHAVHHHQHQPPRHSAHSISLPPPHSPILSPCSPGGGSRPFTPTQLTTHINQSMTSVGSTLLNQYEIIEGEGADLGRGSYGRVVKVRDVKDNSIYAMKVVSKSMMKKKRIMRKRERHGSTTTAVPVSLPGHMHDSMSNEDDTEEWEHLKKEIAIMKKLDHPHIVKLYEVMDDPLTDELYMIMEYCQGGTISEAAQRRRIVGGGGQLLLASASFPSCSSSDSVTPTRTPPSPHSSHDPTHVESPSLLPPVSSFFWLCWTRHYFCQLLSGLSYLHSQHILHRDLKPENILLSHPYGHPDSVVKIADFGMSEGWAEKPAAAAGYPNTNSSSIRLKSNVGSSAFLAPEQCLVISNDSYSSTMTDSITHSQTRTYSHSHSHTAEWSGQMMDIWATGITLYFLLFGSLPFFSLNPHQLYTLIVQQPVSFPAVTVNGEQEAEQWEQAKDLITGMLHKDPQQRFTIQDIIQHPFINRPQSDMQQHAEHRDGDTVEGGGGGEGGGGAAGAGGIAGQHLGLSLPPPAPSNAAAVVPTKGVSISAADIASAVTRLRHTHTHTHAL